jgi:hypothetical protein
MSSAAREVLVKAICQAIMTYSMSSLDCQKKSAIRSKVSWRDFGGVETKINEKLIVRSGRKLSF